MPLDGLTVRALRTELHERLVNGRVFKIFQPWPDTVILHLRVRNKTEQLLLSAAPKWPVACVTELQSDNPLQAPQFAMVLRKYLDPARLLRVEQTALDRVLRFVFETFEPGAHRVERVLVAELMGRHSNIVLLDGRDGTIIDALKRTPRDHPRPLLPGLTYTAPGTAHSAKHDPFSGDAADIHRLFRLAPAPERLSKIIFQHLDGFGPFAAEHTVASAGFHPRTLRGDVSTDDISTLCEALHDLVHAVAANKVQPVLFEVNGEPDGWIFPPAVPVQHVEHGHNVNAVYETLFVHYNNEQRVQAMQTPMLRAVRRSYNRARRKYGQRVKEQQAATRGDEWKHYGDMLQSYLHDVVPHSTEVTVADYTNDYEPLTIPLDPRLTPVQNVQQYYRRYQRAKRATMELETWVSQAEAECHYLESVLVAIELAETEADLEEIKQELATQGFIPRTDRPARQRKQKPAAGEPHRFISSSGKLILVGRNNRQNDRLTLKTARPHDMWLHTKDIPGSHVILRLDDGEALSQDVEEAAAIAAYYSKARQSSGVPVDYVARKHVRKPSGAAPGFVIYDHHRTVYVTPDPKQVAALRAKQ